MKANTQKITQAIENLNVESMNDKKRQKLDRLLFQSERMLAHPAGLPRRPWHKHTVYAPGFYAGYGVKTIPGVREAIEQQDWTEVDSEIETTSQIISDFSDYIVSIANFIAPYSQ